tara:strand:- start:527 stop:667 length:141 start_codon:yes stop_codon:yes gene_type:complete
MILMDIAEWIVNFIAFGLGLLLTAGGAFMVLIIITVLLDRFKNIKA